MSVSGWGTFFSSESEGSFTDKVRVVKTIAMNSSLFFFCNESLRKLFQFPLKIATKEISLPYSVCWTWFSVRFPCVIVFSIGSTWWFWWIRKFRLSDICQNMWTNIYDISYIRTIYFKHEEIPNNISLVQTSSFFL